ncbi:MAG: hypothetical protein K9W44_13270 [Candidatus Lokiarchaeota archaeon]|nr:hypothetical protein [Candidatus Harpocratesius repetitus]
MLRTQTALENSEKAESPFFAIYMLDSNSGVELISHSFIPSRIDLDINAISGMFKALELFINNMAYSNQFETVQEINFQGMRIVYERYGPPHNQILCVGLSRKIISAKKEHHVLKVVIRDFYETYRDQLRNFQGEVKHFQNFYAILQKVPEYFHQLFPYYKPYNKANLNYRISPKKLNLTKNLPFSAGSKMPSPQENLKFKSK